MSMWLDPPDAAADDGLGAGLGLPYSTTGAEGSDSDDLFVPVGEGETWSPDQGYPDSSQSVRIWVDENKRLSNVHISNRWRDRAKGTSLSSMFDEAFLLATAQLADDESGVLPADLDTQPEPTSTEPLTWDSVDEALKRIDQLQAKMAALEAKPEAEVEPSRWVGAEVVGDSNNRMVQVSLDIHGRTKQVHFNEPWLMQSRVSEVRDCVMQAHQAAYKAFQPPTFEYGEHMRLAVEAHRLTEQTMALMRQGGTR